MQKLPGAFETAEMPDLAGDLIYPMEGGVHVYKNKTVVFG